MRFDPNPLRICADRHYVWHDWFAWLPVKLNSGVWCWFEWIERRGEWVYSTAPGPGRYVPCSPFWQWEYRDMLSVTKPRAGKVERGIPPRPER